MDVPVASVYIDHAATTPLRPEVRDAMAPYQDERFGNPSSMHRWGRQARNALEEARERVAAVLGAHRREIVFTGTGTEADNLAVLGRWRSVSRAGGGAIVCSAVEHKAVGEAARCAAAEGAQLILLGVDEHGHVDVGAVDEALAAGPCLVSVMWANNEVGTVQPVGEIGSRCRHAGAAFHTDAVQAFGRVPVRVDDTACDLLSLSAHKIGGPKGIGALYIREAMEVLPLLFGGGQERSLRPGTENVAAAIGFATAAEIAVAGRAGEASRVAGLRHRLEDGLRARVPGLVVNGPTAEQHRLPHILSITVPHTEQEELLIGLDLEGIAASGASACQSGSGTLVPSHVIMAMGGVRPGHATVRLSLGWTTTAADIDATVAAFPRVLHRLHAGAAL
jgi:cysteine desulfurase